MPGKTELRYMINWEQYAISQAPFNQGPGGKLTFRRVSEGKTVSSPPLARRIGVEAGRTAASGVRPASASNTFYRSHSSLGMTVGAKWELFRVVLFVVDVCLCLL